MSQVCFLISVKQCETLLRPVFGVCVCEERIRVCMLFPHFSPPSDMSLKTNVSSFFLPHPIPAPRPSAGETEQPAILLPLAP